MKTCGRTLLVLSDIVLEGVETSNVLVTSISELSIHKGGGVSVGLHVLAVCIATTNDSTTVSYAAVGGRPLLAALMEVLLANVVFCPPEPYRGLLVELRLKVPP